MTQRAGDHREPASGSPTDQTAVVRYPAPAVIDGSYAALFRSSKQELLEAAGKSATMVQTGGAYLAEPFPIPSMDGFTTGLVEPIIETFVVDPGGGCTGTGSDGGLIEAWLPTVRAMVENIGRAVVEFGIKLDGPSYLTASLTPADQVTTVPHLDDDQFVAEEGVGLVAITASHGGPRLAVGVVGHQPARSPLPLEVHPDEFDRFESESIPLQRTDANRIVVFPQFGQMHAGPVIERSTTDPVRRLLVFRAATRPGRFGY